MYYVIFAYNFIIRPYPWFLRQIQVSICWYLHVPFQMVNFLHPILSDLFYPCVLYRTYVWEGGCKTRGIGGIEWVISCVCAQCNFGAKYLLRQTQYWAWYPLWFLDPQCNWGLSSAEYPEIQPRDHNCCPAINPYCGVQNGSVQFCGHESTQSGNYN